MLAARADGRIDFQIFKKFILKSKKVIPINKIIILIFVILPLKLFTRIYLFYIKNFKNKHTIHFSPKLAKAQLSKILSKY